MYTIRVSAYDKKDLPSMMRNSIRFNQSLGKLKGLSHIQDDKIEKLPWGWEMTSYWGTPEEVEKVNYQSDFQSDVEEIIYGTDDPGKAVDDLWDLLADNDLTIDTLRGEILEALQEKNPYKSIINVLINWKDWLD